MKEIHKTTRKNMSSLQMLADMGEVGVSGAFLFIVCISDLCHVNDIFKVHACWCYNF